MSPKDKAKDLFDRFYIAIPSDERGNDFSAAVQCALIAVDEILGSMDAEDDHIKYNYWNDVKQELKSHII